MTVLIQDAPVHGLEHVENLVAMVKKKGSRRMGLMALDTLRELLLSDLLPPHRKLRPFGQRPFDRLEEKASGNRDARDRRLLLWLFEHQLKHHVAEFVAALDTVAHDTVAATKAKALSTAHELLCSRPEQEKALLVQVGRLCSFINKTFTDTEKYKSNIQDERMKSSRKKQSCVLATFN